MENLELVKFTETVPFYFKDVKSVHDALPLDKQTVENLREIFNNISSRGIGTYEIIQLLKST